MSTDQHPSRKTKQSKHSEGETVANLRSLIQGSGSKLIFVNRTARDRKKRLLKLQEEIAQIAQRQSRSICRVAELTRSRLRDTATQASLMPTRHRSI